MTDAGEWIPAFAGMRSNRRFGLLANPLSVKIEDEYENAYAIKATEHAMPPIVITLLSLLVGALLSIYLPMNSMVSRHLGSAITANITFFLMALATSIVLFAVWGDPASLARLRSVPSYLYLTGFVSAFIVLATTYLIPRIGVRQFFILTVSGQILTALVVGHFGLLATPVDPLSAKKLVGAALVVLGAVFSTL